MLPLRYSRASASGIPAGSRERRCARHSHDRSRPVRAHHSGCGLYDCYGLVNPRIGFVLTALNKVSARHGQSPKTPSDSNARPATSVLDQRQEWFSSNRPHRPTCGQRTTQFDRRNARSRTGNTDAASTFDPRLATVRPVSLSRECDVNRLILAITKCAFQIESIPCRLVANEYAFPLIQRPHARYQQCHRSQSFYRSFKPGPQPRSRSAAPTANFA